MFDKRTIGILLVAVLATIASYFYAFDAVCKFQQNCNPGINPTVKHGFPLSFTSESLYAANSYNWPNFALDVMFYVLIILLLMLIVKLIKR